MLKQWCNLFTEISTPGLVLPDVFSVMKRVISAIESLNLCWESIMCNMQRVSHITHNPMGKQKFQIEKSKQYWKKMISSFRKDWSKKLDDALWAYRTTFKTPIDMSPFRLIFGKPCHLPLELEHRLMWAIRNLNFNLKEASEKAPSTK